MITAASSFLMPLTAAYTSRCWCTVRSGQSGSCCGQQPRHPRLPCPGEEAAPSRPLSSTCTKTHASVVVVCYSGVNQRTPWKHRNVFSCVVRNLISTWERQSSIIGVIISTYHGFCSPGSRTAFSQNQTVFTAIKLWAIVPTRDYLFLVILFYFKHSVPNP